MVIRRMENTMYSIFSQLLSQLSASKLKRAYHKQFALFSAVLMSLAISQSAFANDIQATASVSQTRLSTNEVFNLQVAYMGAAHREDFDPSALDKDFTQGSVQFGSSRYSVNGKVTLRSEWNISLATNKSGNVIIPSFEINGVKTDPITLHVSNDPSTPKQSDLISFDDSISKTTLYPKEMATFTSRLLVKTDPRGLQNTNLTPPSGDGLSIEPIGQPNQYQKIINGIETTVVEQDYRVTAEQSGTHQLIPTRLQASVISISRTTGTRRIVPVDVQSDPITLTVKEKPASYQGAWLPTQSLTLQQGWQDSEGNMLDSSTAIDATVGQPITRILALVVQDVSAESLPDIKIDYPNSVRVYSEKPKFGQDKSGNTVMTLKQVIMPKKSGNITLPSVSVPWWNSKANQAETAKVNGVTLKAKVDENVPQPSQALNVQPESTTNTTESDNTAEPKVVSTTNSTNVSFWPYTTALFAALWLITLVLLVQQKRKQPQTPTEEITPSKAQPNSFIDAVKSKDGAKIQSAFAQWQAQHSNVAADLKHNIQSEINALMASLYGPQQQDYDTQTLLKLIKQAEKQSKKKPNNKQDEIAQL